MDMENTNELNSSNNNLSKSILKTPGRSQNPLKTPLKTPATTNNALRTPHTKKKSVDVTFQFDKVFDNVSQKALYEAVEGCELFK